MLIVDFNAQFSKMGSYCSTPNKLGKTGISEISALEAIADRLRVHSIRSTNAAGSGYVYLFL